jgi:rhodanese-related sulfurtransferase/SHS2 domain-containing protein
MTSRPDFIDPEVASEFVEQGRAQLLDARSTQAYDHSRESIPSSVRADPGDAGALTDVLQALPRELLFVAYCDEPGQAASAHVARRVRELGLGDGCYLAGGLRRWREAGLPVELILAPDHLAVAKRDGHRPTYVSERRETGARLTVAGTSLEDVFADAASALMDVVLGVKEPRTEAPSVELTVGAKHPEALLAVWLDEIVAQLRSMPRLYRRVSTMSLTDRELRARLEDGESATWLVDAAKVTLSDVSLERRPEGFAATVSIAFG